MGKRELHKQIPVQLGPLFSIFCNTHFYTQLFYSVNQQQGGPGSYFPSMETEAQGGDDFRDYSLGFLETQKITSNLKLVKTKLQQFLNHVTMDTWGWVILCGEGRPVHHWALSSIPGLHPQDARNTIPLSSDNPRCLHVSLNVPRGQHGPG